MELVLDFVCVSLFDQILKKKIWFPKQFQLNILSFSFFQRAVSYNAYEKDIAIVNIFFGDSTVFGII